MPSPLIAPPKRGVSAEREAPVLSLDELLADQPFLQTVARVEQ